MQNTTNPGQQNSLFTVRIDNEAAGYLKTVASWARIIAIISFCSAALAVLALFIGSSKYSDAPVLTSSVVGVAAPLVSALINLYLFRFANAVQAGLNTLNQGQFNEGVNQLRMYFKIIGMIFIVVVSLMLLAIIFTTIGQALA